MEQGRKKTYTVKNPARLALILGAAVAMLLLILCWTLFLGRVRRQEMDLSAYTTVTRSAETVTAVLDAESLMKELGLPDPRTEPKAAARSRAVKELLKMELELAFTEEPDVIAVTAHVNEGALKRQGLVLKESTWLVPAKVLPRTGPEESALITETADKPRTVLQDGYLSSLLDEEGKGLNLRTVYERVRFERDRLSKEIFGNNYVTKKTNVWFIVYPQGGERHNALRAVFSLTETGTPEGRSIGQCYFTVDLIDLYYRSV